MNSFLLHLFSRLAIPAILALLTFLLPLNGALLRAEEAAPLPGDTKLMAQKLHSEQEIMETLLAGRAKEIKTIQIRTVEIQEGMDPLLEELSRGLDQLGKRFQQLALMIEISRGSPHESKNRLTDARNLEQELAQLTTPAEELSEELDHNLAIVDSMTRELETGTILPDPGIEHRVAKLRDTLKRLAEHIKRSRHALQLQLTEQKLLRGRITERIGALEKGLAQLWKQVFLTPDHSLFTLASWKTVPETLPLWSENLSLLWQSQLPVTRQEWSDWLTKFFIFWLPFYGLILTTVGRSRSVAVRMNSRQRRDLLFAWTCTSLALGILGAFSLAASRRTVLQLTAMSLLIVYGVYKLTWVLRLSLGSPCKKNSPMQPVFALFASGAALDFLNLPTPISSLVLVLLLAVSGWTAWQTDSIFRYEQAVLKTIPFVGLPLAIAATLGLVRLSILGTQAWCLTCIGGQLGVTLLGFLQSLTRTVPQSGMASLAYGLILGFGAPVLWMLILLGLTSWGVIYFGTDEIINRLSTFKIRWGTFSLNLLRIGGIISLFYLTRGIAKTWNSVLSQGEKSWKKVTPGTLASFRAMGGYALWMLFGLLTLYLLGINLTNLAVIAGGLSVGIGFGLQNLINNFISGIILLFGRTIQADDVIQLDELLGVVRRVNIRNTEITTYDNALIFVPNSELISGRLTNWTHRRDLKIRQNITLSVAPGTDTTLLHKLLLEAAHEHPAVPDEPESDVLFTEFAPDALKFTLRVWLADIGDQFTAPSEIRRAIDNKLKQAGIRLAVSRLNVCMRTDRRLRGKEGTPDPD